MQTRCIVKGEAQKSPLFWRFSGSFWFSQERVFSRSSTRKPLNLIKSSIFTNTPCKHTCLYNAPSMHTVDSGGSQKSMFGLKMTFSGFPVAGLCRGSGGLQRKNAKSSQGRMSKNLQGIVFQGVLKWMDLRWQGPKRRFSQKTTNLWRLTPSLRSPNRWRIQIPPASNWNRSDLKSPRLQLRFLCWFSTDLVTLPQKGGGKREEAKKWPETSKKRQHGCQKVTKTEKVSYPLCLPPFAAHWFSGEKQRFFRVARLQNEVCTKSFFEV